MACQKNRYGEIVVPSIATSVLTYSLLNEICGTNVALATALQSGPARNAAITYANSETVSHLNTFTIRRYEPQICSTTIATAIGTTIAAIGIGTNIFIAADIAAMSAPALIVLAMTRPTTTGYNSHRG